MPGPESSYESARPTETRVREGWQNEQFQRSFAVGRFIGALVRQAEDKQLPDGEYEPFQGAMPEAKFTADELRVTNRVQPLVEQQRYIEAGWPPDEVETLYQQGKPVKVIARYGLSRYGRENQVSYELTGRALAEFLATEIQTPTDRWYQAYAKVRGERPRIYGEFTDQYAPLVAAYVRSKATELGQKTLPGAALHGGSPERRDQVLSGELPVKVNIVFGLRSGRPQQLRVYFGSAEDIGLYCQGSALDAFIATLPIPDSAEPHVS